jgi:hypothetical protein
MNQPSAFLFFALLSGLATLGCRNDDTADAVPVETDTDGTDPCAGAPSRQEFVDQQISRLCEYSVPCEGSNGQGQAACEQSLSGLYGSATCFDECLAVACIAWLDTDPDCGGSDPDLHPSCLDLLDCEN